MFYKIILIFIMIFFMGCESPSDPYLESVANEEAIALHNETGADIPEVAMIKWGDESECYTIQNVIFIDRDLKGNDADVHWVVRHELQHLMGLIPDNI